MCVSVPGGEVGPSEHSMQKAQTLVPKGAQWSSPVDQGRGAGKTQLKQLVQDEFFARGEQWNTSPLLTLCTTVIWE